MFDHVTLAPPDSILGITEAFNKDPNPAKINLSVGVYKDAAGKTPVLPSVKEAEKRILAGEASKGYMPIDGSPAYTGAVQTMLFGEGHEVITNNRAATCHTPGGTGGLRVAGDYLAKIHNKPIILVSDPTWANHDAIFQASGLNVQTYPYFDAKTNGLNFEGMIAALKSAAPGSVVLLHGTCHNPTGVDPTPEQWKTIAETIAEKGLLPLVDFAYQGFAVGIREDATCLTALLAKVKELIVVSSFSKNFGLYNERTGAMTIVAASAEAATKVMSQVKVCIRTNYSNPPAHGGMIVTTILSDPALNEQWVGEVKQMRERIHLMRESFVQNLDRRGVKLSPAGNDFIILQHGMFSFSNLNKDQVKALKERFSIYIVGSGRINVAGMTDANMRPLCDAIAAVVE
ncbi:MAG: amino acid aminotransferase [Phycisphaeraceae bacterium]